MNFATIFKFSLSFWLVSAAFADSGFYFELNDGKVFQVFDKANRKEVNVNFGKISFLDEDGEKVSVDFEPDKLCKTGDVYEPWTYYKNPDGSYSSVVSIYVDIPLLSQSFISLYETTVCGHVLMSGKIQVYSSLIKGGADRANPLVMTGPEPERTLLPMLLQNITFIDQAWGKIAGDVRIHNANIQGLTEIHTCRSFSPTSDPLCSVQLSPEPGQYNRFSIDIENAQLIDGAQIYGQSNIIDTDILGPVLIKTNYLAQLSQTVIDNSSNPTSVSTVSGFNLELIGSNLMGKFHLDSQSETTTRLVEVNFLQPEDGSNTFYQELLGAYEIAYASFSGESHYNCTGLCGLTGTIDERQNFHSNNFQGDFDVFLGSSEGNYINTHVSDQVAEGYVKITGSTLGSNNQFHGSVTVSNSHVGDGVILRGATESLCLGCTLIGLHINEQAFVLGPDTLLSGWLYIGGGTINPNSNVIITRKTFDSQQSRIHGSTLINGVSILGSILAVDTYMDGLVLPENDWICDSEKGCRVWDSNEEGKFSNELLMAIYH